MRTKKTREELIEIAKKFEKVGVKIGKVLGEGGYGLVVDVIYGGKKRVGKLIKKEVNDETNVMLEFKGPNIIKVVKIFEQDEKESEEEGDQYKLIIMEKANLKDLTAMFHKMSKNQIFKLIINSPFEGSVSDNFIKYISYEIIKGLESLERSEYSHFDIKPDNILIFFNLIMKLSDFSLLRSPKKIKRKDGNICIPGGTIGYLSPEYYENKYVPIDVAKKQDYFALGSTIYYLKYGHHMLDNSLFKDGNITSDHIIDLIQKAMDLIKSKKLSDQDFIDFLCNLINYKPNERPIFEEIYRNKWLNKNLDKINFIYKTNNQNEEKLVMELNKSDYLIHKKNELKKNRKKFTFNKKGKI